MQEVKAICDRLQATSGKIEKKNILKEASSNKLFKYILNFLLNSTIVTGISTAKMKKKIDMSIILDDDIEFSKKSFPEVLEYIKIHNTGTNDVLWKIEYWLRINSSDEEMTSFYKSIISKSLRLGVYVKTANDVYGRDFVFEYAVQLGTPIDKVKLNKTQKIYLSQKVNGFRCTKIFNSLYSRQGKEYTGYNHILEDIKALGVRDNIVFDGELIRKNIDKVSDSANFQMGASIVSSKDSDKTQMKYIIFDVITEEDFRNGVSAFTYSERKKALLSIQDKIAALNLKNIEVIRFFYEGFDYDEIDKWLEYCEKNDMEGCMINYDAPYECRRVTSLIKVKKFYTCDIRCIRLEHGKTASTEKTLGSIICNYKGFEVAVSGFSNEFANYYWNHPDEIIGKIIEVKYKEETQNKQGGLSLQFPKYVTIRTDKDEESYN